MFYFLLDSQENYKNIFNQNKKTLLLNNTYTSSNSNLDLDIIEFENIFFLDKFINFLAFLTNFLILLIDNKSSSNTQTESLDSSEYNNSNSNFSFLYIFEELNKSTSFEFRIFLFLTILLVIIIVLIVYFWKKYSLNIKNYYIIFDQEQQLQTTSN
jgi:hypothetical protein